MSFPLLSQALEERVVRSTSPSLLSATVGQRLLTRLDDGSGCTSPDKVIALWTEEGIHNSRDVLQARHYWMLFALIKHWKTIICCIKCLNNVCIKWIRIFFSVNYCMNSFFILNLYTDSGLLSGGASVSGWTHSGSGQWVAGQWEWHPSGCSGLLQEWDQLLTVSLFHIRSVFIHKTCHEMSNNIVKFYNLE